MDRRDFLKTAVATAAIFAFPSIVLGRDQDRFVKKISLYNTSTGESFNGIYSENGKYDIEELVNLSRFLRDIHTNEIYPIDINLVEYINRVQSMSDQKYAIMANSGYRSKSTQRALLAMPNSQAAEDSFHPKGMAIDLSLHPKARVDLYTLKERALMIREGGVGFYPNRNFMHLDSGRFRTWSC
jgi:uncharacterized protein YcbK (DUF882 family)